MNLKCSQDSNLGLLDSSQIFLPTEPCTGALALEQRIWYTCISIDTV